MSNLFNKQTDNKSVKKTKVVKKLINKIICCFC